MKTEGFGSSDNIFTCEDKYGNTWRRPKMDDADFGFVRDDELVNEAQGILANWPPGKRAELMLTLSTCPKVTDLRGFYPQLTSHQAGVLIVVYSVKLLTH